MSLFRVRIEEDPVQRPESGVLGSDSADSSGSGVRVIRLSRNPGSPVLDSTQKSEIEMTITADDSNPMDDDAVCKRYVVLIAPGEQLPAPLMELLSDRSDDSANTNVFTANHPLMAISLLGRLERERRLQRKWELNRQNVLVVANRDSWGDLSGLFNSTRQYMPSVPIWNCSERIAMEIYAGDPDAGDAEEKDRSGDVPDPAPEAGDAEEPERTTLSSDELQELLDALDFEDHADDESEDRGPRTS
ncbi:MAG: hypothetical protein CMJ34_10695 [Phycisphaerae bacterium]|nr:hypothetical protein [Phycisphaerae bacterium]